MYIGERVSASVLIVAHLATLLMVSMGELQRDKSVHFYHKHLKGIIHNDVIESIKEFTSREFCTVNTNHGR